MERVEWARAWSSDSCMPAASSASFIVRHLANIGVLNERDHRKLAIVDGRVAFVGGHCIVDSWQAEEGAKERVMDVSVRLRGPIVHSMQSAFSENWVGQTGELFMGEGVFPPLERAGDIAIHAAFVKPEGSAPAVKILHHAAICCARSRIWIQNPYFLPEPAAIDALGDAVKRGVDVRVLMPSTSGSDNPMVQHAGHRNFEKLLRCGVRLIEYPSALLHQKIMTIDGLWCAVGTANFDDRSFETNDEITVSLHRRRDRAAVRRDFRALCGRWQRDRTRAMEPAESDPQARGPGVLPVQRASLSAIQNRLGLHPSACRRRLPIEVAPLTVR